MGRRALRKIDPALDLSAHYFELESLDLPLDWGQFFARPELPCELEVGSGKGLFLATAAGDHPERNFVGVEIARKYARYSAARLARADRTNAVMIQGDAMRLLTQGLPAASLHAVHVYFPDPWWKKRHHKRRILNPRFAAEVVRVLVEGGRLHFWTDVLEYYQATLEMLATVTALSGPQVPDERQAEHDLDYRTHFERRTRLHQAAVYRAEYRKT